MCENRAKDNPQNWWAVWGVEVKPAGTSKFNVLSRNDYSTLVPGYLSLRSNYSTLHRMVPNPNKLLRDPVENKRYALYIAFKGKLPKENSGTGAGFDYYDEESDMEEVNVPAVVLLDRTHVSPYALQKNGDLILGQLYM
jgi:hypothetical protein